MSVMKSCVSLLAVAMLAGSPALADMVAASPGVTLTEAAQAKFNADTRGDDQYVKPVPGSSGIPAPLYSAAGVTPEQGQGWTLQQVAAAKFSSEGYSQGRLTSRSSAPSASLAYGQDRDYSALASAAGLSPGEASGMSFDEIANAYLDTEH
jgi:hypothetical protein